MQQPELIPHLFRTEYRKVIAVLCKRFGFDQIEIAEDIASDTFMSAAQTWGLQGIPPNPVAWLYTVAKNNAKNYLQRKTTFTNKVIPETSVQNDTATLPDYEIDLSPQNINDSQLQMMFAICHPAIPPEAQIGLSLRILCGFGIEEIADAFLTNKETIRSPLNYHLLKPFDTAKARQHFEKALSLAKTITDRQTIQRKVDQLTS